MNQKTKRKRTLNDMANRATENGMTYGKYQALETIQSVKDDSHEEMRSHQPVYVHTTGEYLCPLCGGELEIRKNCPECRHVIIWKVR